MNIVSGAFWFVLSAVLSVFSNYANASIIYWDNGTSIVKTDVSTNNTTHVAYTNNAGSGARPTDIVLDSSSGSLYWAYWYNGVVQSTSTNGGVARNVILPGSSHPMGLAVLPNSTALYIANASNPSSSIRMVSDPLSYAGSSFSELATFAGPYNVKGVAVDASSNALFYGSGGSIWKSDLDGRNPQRVLSASISSWGLSIDTTTRKLYWAEPYSPIEGVYVGRIVSANYDGSDYETVVSGELGSGFLGNYWTGVAREVSDIAVDVSSGRIYWTNWYFPNGNGPSGLVSANLDGSNISPISYEIMGGFALESVASDPEPTLQELASFAWNPYEIGNDAPPIGSAVPSGFIEIAQDFGDDYAYHTAAYKRGNDIVIAFEGTFFWDLRDWMVNYGYGSGVPNPRVVEFVGEAAQFVAEIASAPENQGANIQLVGHSLGGGIAQLIGDASGYETTTFNSAGAAFLVEAVDELLAPVRGLSQVDHDITHYRVEGDPVSLLTDQIQPENIVTIQSPSGPVSVMPHELVNLGYYHSIETVWVALGADLPRVNGVPDSNILASIALIVNPVLSAVDGTKEFMSWVASFGDPYYFDPPHAYGYVFDRGTGPLFTSVLLPARDDEGLYEFFLPRGGDWILSGLLNGFDWYTFDEPLARFAIGNMPNYGPTLNGSVFGLTFASTGTFDGTISPVERQMLVPAVPEPGTLILVGLGMGGIGLMRFTRRRTH